MAYKFCFSHEIHLPNLIPLTMAYVPAPVNIYQNLCF